MFTSHPCHPVALLGIVLHLLAVLPCTAATGEVSAIVDARIVPFTTAEHRHGLHRLARVLGDRFEYWNDDAVGQFHIVVPLPPQPAAEGQAPPPAQELSLSGYRLRVRLLGDGAGAIAEQVLAAPQTPKAHVQVAVGTLKPGAYALEATLEDAAGAATGEPVSFAFNRVDKQQQVATFPAEGLPILLEDQSHDPEASWPVTAAIPLPLNAVTDVARLAVFHNNKPVPSQAVAAAHWSPGGSVQWAHVSFVATYVQGKASGYRLQLLSDAIAPVKPSLRIEQDAKTITVDTGAIRFNVRRQGFNGIDRAWFDPSGQSRYDTQRPVIDSAISGQSSPYLIDGRLVRFETRYDKDVSVELENAGPAQVTIVARGWYVRDAKQSESLCQFVTRITAAAGQPTLRISHHVILTYDTRTTRLADVGFPIPVVDAGKFAIGFDGRTQHGDLPVIPREIKARRDGTRHIPSVYLVQERWDALRLVGVGTEPIVGGKSDGWFTITPTNGDGHSAAVAIVLRDIWQKFPKEVQLSRQAATVHLWPAHGREVFSTTEELAPQNIHKFWSFHQGAMLDLNLPNRYYEALNANPETWIECWPQNALNGNGQGLAMSAEFEVSCAPVDDMDADRVSRRAALVQFSPAAMASPTWNAVTNAAGAIAAEDPAFADTDAAFLQGMLSYSRSVERGQAYGMWIWPDTHNKWNIPEKRPNLHRPWQNSHYHQAGSVWLMWLRSGSPDMLRWARTSNDHYRNVSTVNYGKVITDAAGRGRWEFMSHIPGAMYHCKAPTPWGGSDYGMVRNNDHAALAAHWTSPDAHLWAWLMSAEPRARDLYHLWHQSVRQSGTMIKGVRREANTTLALLITAYQYTHDIDLLPAIHGLGRSLRTNEPLSQQMPGPFWHPLWMNRYYEQTRDPQYVPFILEHAGRTALADTWLLGLSALAYEITGDKAYLTQHFNRIEALPMTMLHAPGDVYDWYGMGPGPLGFRWGEMTWGHFLRQLQRAGVKSIQPTGVTHGAYPCASVRNIASALPGIVILAHEESDRDIKMTLPLRNPHPAIITVLGPRNTRVFNFDMKSSQVNRSDTRQQLPADGATGVYRIEARSHDVSMPMPMTDLPHEAALLDDGRGYLLNRLDGWLAPVSASGVCELIFTSQHDDDVVNVRVMNQKGAVIGQASLLRSLGRTTTSVTLDPSQPDQRPPWRIRLLGPGSMVARGGGPMLLATTPEALAAIGSSIK